MSETNVPRIRQLVMLRRMVLEELRDLYYEYERWAGTRSLKKNTTLLRINAAEQEYEQVCRELVSTRAALQELRSINA